MLRGRLKYIALLIFLFGLILIVFLQFNSGRSINRLIGGNTDLLNELEARNELQKLETEIVNAESRVRDIVIAQDRSGLGSLKKEIETVQQRLKQIEDNTHDPATGPLVKELGMLVSRKIAFNLQVLDTFNIAGKNAAERIINASSKQLTDSIFDAVDHVDSSRQAAFSQIINVVDESGRVARNRGFILAMVACAFCIVAFWYIVNQSMRQQQLIRVLDASEKKVREAARVKEQFLANMSHEIRTPMNAILGFTNLLHKTALDTNQKQYAENIRSSGEKLLAIVNDILDLSKIEAGMMPIEPAPFSLRALMHSVETMFSHKAADKNLLLEFSVERTIPDILEGDAVRLTQVLVNLLGNAIKFTDQGKINVFVKLAEQLTNRVRISFSVKDTGIGIPRDKQQKIFERFQQAESDTTRRYGGTGLGLSIARQIIDLQHGNIRVESEPGQGTEFVFELAYNISAEKLDASEQSPAIGSPARFAADTTILIVEDNPMNQQLMKHLMDNWKLNYRVVSNGREALKALEESRFDLVLMDIQMPELDGYHTTVLIRENLKSMVPVIAMTAHAMAGEREKCISYGMDDYISKPVRESELYSLILHYTGKRNTATNGHDNRIIDLGYLKEISKGNEQFESEMIHQFIVQVPEEMNTLKSAIANADFTLIRQVAHGLKSSVSFVGLSSVLDPLLYQIEANAIAGENIPAISSDFVQMQQLCDAALREARSLLP